MANSMEQTEEINDFTTDQAQEQIKAIDAKINALSNRLKIPDKIRKLTAGGIVGYMLAKMLKQSNDVAIMAAAGGAYAGNQLPTKEITQEEREAINNKIEQLQSQKRAIMSNIKVENGEALTAQEITHHEIERLPFTGKFAELIGQPSIPFHTLIYGKPKSGKSIFSLIFADYLATNFGDVLYIASEEGYKGTLKQKVNEFTSTPADLHFIDLRDFDAIYHYTDKNKFDFIFIDSVDFCKITVDQVEVLKANNPGTSVAIVKQATKAGDFRGSQEYAHNCDVMIDVREGVAYSKGRFNAGGEMLIFEENLKNENE